MDGDQQAIITNICQSWGKKFYRFADDIHSCAILACLEAEQRNKDHPNMTGLLILVAQGGIKDFLRSERRYSEKITSGFDLEKYEQYHPSDTLPLECCLDECGFTEEELFIIEQRLHRHSEQEIANMLGVSRTTLINKMAKIREKVTKDLTDGND